MEEKGYIEIRVNNIEGSFNPENVDINDVRSVILNIETFLFPTAEEKRLRPQISYDLDSGSAVHKFLLPISLVILFNGLTAEIKKRNSLEFLDHKRQEIIYSFQDKAFKEGLFFEFASSLSLDASLMINPSTNFKVTLPQFYESEFYLYGEIYQEGGKKPNIHISTTKFGNLTVSATKEQIIEGDKKTYQPYGIKVRGKKGFNDEKPFDLTLIDFVNYRPVYDKSLLERVIAKASTNLSKIKNVDSWIGEMKGDGV